MNIKYVIVKNEMPASSTEAKYIGRAIPNGVRNRAQMTANALKTEHFAEATFDSVLDAAVAVTQELCALGHDVDWGPMKFIAKMHGSLPCEDSAFADGTASLTVDADGTNALRAVLDTLVPVKISAAEASSLVKVSNVMDVGTEAFGTVVGTGQFAVLGNGVTLDGEGEYAKALDKKTLEVKGTATVVSVSKGQRAYCKFDPQLAAGDYTLEVATKGLIGETTPRVFRKPFTSVYVPPTPIYTSTLGGTHIYTGKTTAGDVLPTDDIHVTSADDVVVFTGDMKQTDTARPTTGITSAFLMGCGDENLPLTLVFDTANGKMTAKLGLAMFQIDPGTYENAKIKLVCYKDGQTDSLEIAKKVIKSE